MKHFGKLFMTTTLLLTMAVAANGQTTTVKGVLMDKQLGEGEPYATVRVYKADGQDATPTADKAVSMFLTGADGSFSQQVSGKGRFKMVFSSVGKLDLVHLVELGSQQVVNVDTLFLQADENVLKGVEVVAQKPLVKMEVDKMSYNVAEDEDSKSATVLDMLRKVPMVTVDGQDNITVNGSSSFKVYVDGMPNVMFSSNPSMVFKSMPASAVKSIEVTTNPGAKYDAEGAAGVLNIVMNKLTPMGQQSMNGYNGTLRASAGNKQLGGSAFISGQQGKLSYSANVMTSYNKPGNTTTEMANNFGTASAGQDTAFDLTDRYSKNKDKTTNHIFQLDYTMPLTTGQTLSLGGKLQLHDATSDAKYYLKQHHGSTERRLLRRRHPRTPINTYSATGATGATGATKWLMAVVSPVAPLVARETELVHR